MASALVLAACAGCESQPAPESPAPARQVLATRPPVVDGSALRRTVELRGLRVRRPDEELGRIFGPALPPRSVALVVEVRTREPLDVQARTSWPVILLNGEPLVETRRGSAADLLLGLIPDPKKLRDRNTVEVAWVGNESLTRTRAPLSFGPGDLPK